MNNTFFTIRMQAYISILSIKRIWNVNIKVTTGPLFPILGGKSQP